MLSLQEKIDLILKSNSLNDVPREALPSSHKEDYYFISYSHKDYKEVLKDILLLETYGINIWYDDEMHIGENWKDIAELYISKFHCKGVIFYLSENSISSKACNEEIEYVLKKNKSFFSINIAKDGDQVESGLAMLKRYGLDKDRQKLSLFEKAFPNEVLYLSYNDSIERKVHEISKMVGEDLLSYRIHQREEIEFSFGVGKTTKVIPIAEVESCNDNQIIKLKIPDYIYVDEKEVEVYQVLSCVFANCINLETVELPKSIKIIGEYAFKNCLNLKKVNLDNVHTLESNCFANCKKLKVENIPSSLSEYAFMNCESLENIVLSDRHNTDIPKGCFLNCKNLKSIATMYINTFYKGIGEDAFNGCNSLEIVNLGDVGEYEEEADIGNNAFKDCSSLKEIHLRGPWKLSGNFIFENCTSLKKVKLDKGINVLSAGAFLNCTSLKEIIGFKRIKILNGGSIFYKTPILDKLDFNHIKRVYGRAFYGLKREHLSLDHLQITEGNILEGIEGLKKVTVGNHLEIVNCNAFTKCSTLEEVTLGTAVKEIWFDALSSNPNLQKLILRSKKSIKIDSEAFVGSPISCVQVDYLPALKSVLKEIKKNKFLEISKEIEIEKYAKLLKIENFIYESENDGYYRYARYLN